MLHTVQILFPFTVLPFLRAHFSIKYSTIPRPPVMMSAITNCHFMMVRCIFATKVSQIKQKNRHVCARGGALFIQKPTLCWPDGQALFQRMDIPAFFPLVLAFSPPQRVCLYQSSPGLCYHEIGWEFSLLRQGRSVSKMVKQDVA